MRMNTACVIWVRTTLPGRSLEQHLRQARLRGYSISLVLVYLDSVGLCLQRIAQRVIAGGHDVPESDVRRRYRRSLVNFLERYRGQTDDWMVVFNGESGYETIASGWRENIGDIMDETLWGHLLRQTA